jgi:hypothetical protein
MFSCSGRQAGHDKASAGREHGGNPRRDVQDDPFREAGPPPGAARDRSLRDQLPGAIIPGQRLQIVNPLTCRNPRADPLVGPIWRAELAITRLLSLAAPKRLPTANRCNRCDRCGARAYVRVLLPSDLELLFCAHRNRQYASALARTALDIQGVTGGSSGLYSRQ